MKTPEERAGEVRLEFDYDGTVHAEATRANIAAAIREAQAEAVAAERERCAGICDRHREHCEKWSGVEDGEDHAAWDAKSLTAAYLATNIRAGKPPG